MFSVECWRKICLWRYFSRLPEQRERVVCIKIWGRTMQPRNNKCSGSEERDQILQALKDSRMTHVTLNRGEMKRGVEEEMVKICQVLAAMVWELLLLFYLFVSKSCFPILPYTYSVFFFWLCWVFVLHRLFSSHGKWGLLSSCSMWVSFVAEHGL